MELLVYLLRNQIMSLHFEQLENKIALSTLSGIAYHGRKASIPQTVHQNAQTPITKPVIVQNQVNPTIPIKFVQNIAPDGSIRCVINQSESLPINTLKAVQTVENLSTVLPLINKHPGAVIVINYSNEFTVNGCVRGSSGESYCYRIAGPDAN